MVAANSLMNMNNVDGQLLEKVILGNDFSGLSPIEKVQHIKNICMSLGLNPLTKPIQLIKFQGKEIPYVTKDATEQLRKINNVSISGLDTKLLDGIYVVTANASTNGRSDSSTGVISIKGLTGDALANAMMKAETKAKRRATLSICGLGFLEESELDTLKGYEKVEPIDKPILIQSDTLDDMTMKITNILLDISQARDLEELKNIYANAMMLDLKPYPKLKVQIVKAKDDKKVSLMNKSMDEDFSEETGEI